jgi:hypothetical protein
MITEHVSRAFHGSVALIEQPTEEDLKPYKKG